MKSLRIAAITLLAAPLFFLTSCASTKPAACCGTGGKCCKEKAACCGTGGHCCKEGHTHQ